jgi:hypothetical protein
MTTADGSQGYRFLQAYGQLEFRMNNLMPDEESRILGLAYAALAVLGTPNNGDVITVVVSNGGLPAPQTLVATAGPSSGDVNLDQLAMTQLLTIAAISNSVMVNAGFQAVAPFSAGPFTERYFPNPTFALTNLKPFQIAVTFTPEVACQVQKNGEMLTPLYVANQGTPSQVNVYGYLNILDLLEGAQASTTENLDTSRADVWYARQSEIRERAVLYKQWRTKLAMFLALPLGDPISNRSVNATLLHV